MVRGVVTGVLKPMAFAGVIIMVVALVPWSMAFGQDAPPHDYVQPAPVRASVAARLVQRAREEGPQLVIVGLNTPFQPGRASGSPGRQAMVSAIGRKQDDIVAALRGGFRVAGRFERSIPFMVIEADADALEQLATMADVTSIEENLPERPSMTSSNPVIGSPVAWAAGLDGAGWTVAVLDTGVAGSHSWLSGKVVSEACYSSDTSSSDSVCPLGGEEETGPGSGVNCPLSIDGCDHGTHVAGTAVGNNGVGPGYGVARGANVIAVQVFADFDGDALSYPSDQIKGLVRVKDLAASFNIAAVNMSLGGGAYTSESSCDSAQMARKAAIADLRALDIAVVISSGNSGFRTAMGAPGCISNAVAVGATEDDDDVASFSNIASFIELLAPGVSITSSVPGGGTSTWNGTSMAAPHVTGAWAIMKQAMSGGTVDQILGLLQSSGVLVDDLRAGGEVTDIPRIDLAAALSVEFDADPAAGSTIDFGDVHVSVTSAGSTVTIYNTGGQDMTLGCSISGADNASFGHSACPATVASGGMTDIILSCTPAGTGALSASFDVTTNDVDEASVSWTLDCDGISPEFGSTPTPGSTLNFGDVDVGVTSAAMPVNVDNSGTTALSIACAISGAGASHFGIAACPTSIGAGLNDDVDVTCQPGAIGALGASLDLTTNDADEPTASYNLSCNGLGPEFGSNPAGGATIDLGAVIVGQSGATDAVVVSNSGNETLNIASCTLLGGDSGDFSLTQCPASISPAGNASVEFHCEPLNTGALATTLRLITDDFDEGTVDYDLECTGTAPDFDPNPAGGTPRNFGDVEIDTTSAALTVSIGNIGTAVLNVTTCEISGADAAAFGLGGCPATVNPASSADVSVTCEPTALGSKSASLDVVTDDSTGGSASWPLSCESVPPDEFFGSDFE